MKYSVLFAIAFAYLLAGGCTSGKKAYKQGDYYEAVLSAVQRLRQKPDHKKSKEVLSLSYQMAVDYLNTDAENQLSSNANFKWRSALQDYEKINHLYEEIRTSPGALKVIPKPVSKYDKVDEAKSKAAEETYEAGIQALLKDTREDAKRAYFLFTEANTYSPGYREAIEMIEQSKFNATLKVVVEPAIQNAYSWNFDPVLFGYKGNQFVQFYSPREASDQNLKKIDQFVKVVVNGYSESRPTVTKKVENYKDSVKTGEKTVGGKKVPVRILVNGQATIYEKKVTSRGSISLVIIDGSNKANLRDSEIVDDQSWSDTWATCAGDSRAIPDGVKKLCAKREPYMASGALIDRTKKGLDSQLASALSGWYSQY